MQKSKTLSIHTNIDRPIFVIGLGRSGSSIFHEILAKHEHVAWLSGILNRYPARPELNVTMALLSDIPALRTLMPGRFGPQEVYRFWEHNCRGFRSPFRDLTSGDVTPKAGLAIVRALERCTSARRARLLAKITGWPRIGYLRSIFPDAIFIHVKRDPFALINSILNVDWWWGWQGPSNWRWGPLPADLDEIWRKHDQSFVALAALEYVIYYRALHAAQDIDDSLQFVDVSYESLCDQPEAGFRSVLENCDLVWTRDFSEKIKAADLRSTNHKWQEELSVDQQSIIADVLDSCVGTHGNTKKIRPPIGEK